MAADNHASTMIDHTMKALRSPWSRHGLEQKTVSAVTLLLLSGCSLSSALNEWNMLALSGAAVVVLGIYLTFRDIAGTIDHVGGDLTQTFRGWRDEVDASNGKGVIDQVRQENLKGSISTFERQMHELLALARSRVRKLEAGCLMLGTPVSSGAWMVPKLLT